MSTRTQRRRILRVSGSGDTGDTGDTGSPAGSAGSRADLLAVEEPLEIRIGGTPLTVTMRTPGDDIDLAAGFLFGEGLIGPAVDLRQIRMCDENVADVTLEVAAPAEAVARATDARRAQRSFLTTSACGVCGKESIDAIRVKSQYDLTTDLTQVSPDVLLTLPGRLRDAQRVFASTGGLHAAGLFTPDGTLLALREDVGRHNAVDKITGWALREGRLPLTGHVLLVSGRASFELVQKAAMAGIPVMAAVSAPSSLAADLAEETGMTLVGFLRGTSMNAYTATHRLAGVPAFHGDASGGAYPTAGVRRHGSPLPGARRDEPYGTGPPDQQIGVLSPGDRTRRPDGDPRGYRRPRTADRPRSLQTEDYARAIFSTRFRITASRSTNRSRRG